VLAAEVRRAVASVVADEVGCGSVVFADVRIEVVARLVAEAAVPVGAAGGWVVGSSLGVGRLTG
jgi:hypothetical protein